MVSELRTVRSVACRAVILAWFVLPLSAAEGEGPSVERGRYLIHIAGCNDCHTPGYAPAEGQVAESEWLLGDSLGWKGPWGTTYASNLRLTLSTQTEDQWVSFAQNLKSRPPMPYFNLNAMTADDLRSMYRYVRQLQPVGEAAPAYLPPGQQPPPPYVDLGPPPGAPE